MLKILFTLLLLADSVILLLLMVGSIFAIFAGGGNFNILLPGLGLIISFPAILIFLLIIESILISVTIIIFRLTRKHSDKLA